jgi:hypothetical protein
MPQFIIPGISAAVAASTATLGPLLIYTGVSFAVSAVVSFALQALAPKPSASSQGLLTNAREPAAAREYVYGTVRKGGVVTYLESTGTNNKFLHMVICLAGHEVDQIGDIYINDEVVTIDGSNMVTSAPWANKIRIKKHRGDQTVVDSDLLSESAQVTSDFKGLGIAYLYVRLEYDSNVFSSGIPLFTAEVQGRRVYDPRDASTDYSANWALCDEAVTLDAGGTQNRYEMHGVISAASTPNSILTAMMTAGGGTLFWGQGKWQARPGYYTSPVKTLTLDDLRGPISVQTRTSRRDNFNAVVGTFNDAAQDYISADYPKIESAAFLAEDNGIENTLDLELPMTTNAAMAQRLAKQTLFRAREQIRLTAEFGLAAFDVEVGDIVAFTNDRYGWTAKEFEVREWRFFADNDAGDLRVRLALQETSEEAFDWDAEEAAILANNTSILSATDIPAITLGVTEATQLIRNQATNVVVINTGAAPVEMVEQVEIQYKLAADSDYTNLGRVGLGNFIVPDLAEGTYDFRARAIAPWGRAGDWTTEEDFVVDFANDYRAVYNGKFASGFDGWTQELLAGKTASIVSRDSASVEDAEKFAPTTRVLRVDCGAVSIGTQFIRFIWERLIPVQPGIDVFAEFRHSAGDGTTYAGNVADVRIVLRWYDEDGVQLSSPDDETDDKFGGAVPPITAGVYWQLWQRTATPPPGAAFCKPVLELTGARGLIYFADVTVEVAINTARIGQNMVTDPVQIVAGGALVPTTNSVEEVILSGSITIPALETGTAGESVAVNVIATGFLVYSGNTNTELFLEVAGSNTGGFNNSNTNQSISISGNVSLVSGATYNIRLKMLAGDITRVQLLDASISAVAFLR